MNERIKQLYEQASIRYSVYETLKPQDERKIIPDIFAELIVQECMNVLHDNELWNRHISHALKEHFGVEG